jgi:hypothetical protein
MVEFVVLTGSAPTSEDVHADREVIPAVNTTAMTALLDILVVNHA